MRDVTAPAGPRRRWMTLIFCVAPLVVLIAVFVFRIPISQVLLWALILLCPLSHLLHGHGGRTDGQAQGARTSGATGAAGSNPSQRSGSCH